MFVERQYTREAILVIVAEGPAMSTLSSASDGRLSDPDREAVELLGAANELVLAEARAQDVVDSSAAALRLLLLLVLIVVRSRITLQLAINKRVVHFVKF